jgi:hypothetical protein
LAGVGNKKPIKPKAISVDFGFLNMPMGWLTNSPRPGIVTLLLLCTIRTGTGQVLLHPASGREKFCPSGHLVESNYEL